MTLRAGLRRLSTGLLVYGTIGLIVAAIGLAAIVYVGNRLGGIAERTSQQVDTLIGSLERGAVALDDAGASALSFAGTLERTPDSVLQAADTVTDLRANLLDIEQRLGDISILGSRPLGGVADRFGQMAATLEGLDMRLVGIAEDLGDNREKLLANASSLSALGERLDDLAAELRTGIVQDSLDDIQVIVRILGLLFVLWMIVPAIGALALGWWLRRETVTTISGSAEVSSQG